MRARSWVVGVVGVASLACGGGDPAGDALVAAGVEVRGLEPDGDGWRWAGVRGAQFCQGHLVVGVGLGPLRLPPQFTGEACDPVGGAVELAWTCEHEERGAACRDAGVLLQQARDSAALPLLEKACSLGEGAGCRLAGIAHRHGQLGAVRDASASADWLERGCNLGDDRSCLQRGRWPAGDGLGCDTDAQQWYRRGGAESKAAWADQEAGCEGGDPAKARSLWKEACDGGSLEACRKYGYALVDGVGGHPSFEEGVAVFHRGCRAEPPDLQACIDFGLTLMATGDPVSGPKALAAFQKACDAGVAVGCRDVGVVLRDGLAGVAPDGVAARVAFQKGCDGGDDEACRVPGIVRR